jgi:hypothetical protein
VCTHIACILVLASVSDYAVKDTWKLISFALAFGISIQCGRTSAHLSIDDVQCRKITFFSLALQLQFNLLKVLYYIRFDAKKAENMLAVIPNFRVGLARSYSCQSKFGN